MSERSVRTILVSLILHLIILLILPGPYARKEPEDKSETIELLLTMQSRQGEKGTPAPSQQQQKPKPAPPEPTPPQPPEQQPEETQPEKQPRQPEREPEQDPTPEPEQTVEDKPVREPKTTRQPEPEKEPRKKPEPRPEETPTQEEQPSPESTEKPTLLTRKGRFRSPSSEPAESSPSETRNQESDKTVLKDPFQRIRVSAKLAREMSSPSSSASEIQADEPEQKTVVARVPVVHIGRTRNREPVNYSVELPSQTQQSGSSSSKGRKALSQPLPSVPGWLEREGEEARVVVQYTLGAEGSVQSLRIIQSSGFPALDDEVIEKVRKWKFEAGPDGEKRIVAFRFELSPSPET